MKEDLNYIQQCIEKDFGLPLSNFRPTGSGRVSHSFFAEINNKEVVVKYTKSNNSYPKEIFFYNSVRKHVPINVPNIIDYRENSNALGFPCLIISKIPGNPL